MLGRLIWVPHELRVPLTPPTVREVAQVAELEVADEEVVAVGAMADVLGETVADLVHLEGGGRERERDGINTNDDDKFIIEQYTIT